MRRDPRPARISMVMQDPKFSLNPVMTVGRQIAEAYRVHTKASRREARRRALDMLEAVRIRDPERVFDLYPHEVSGGMGQRVMIAMMLIPEPDLLIADEPTSALDVTVQMQVLAILDDLVTQRGMGLIFISHDLNLVRVLLRPRPGHVCRPGGGKLPRGELHAREASLHARPARLPAALDDGRGRTAGADARSRLAAAERSTRHDRDRRSRRHASARAAPFTRSATSRFAVDARARASAWSANPAPASRPSCGRCPG